MKSLAKLTVRLFVLGVLCLLAAVLYLDMKGFPPALKELVEQQFLRAGYAVQFGELHLDVLRGVVARDARVADAKERTRLLAQIDEVQLQWNWGHVFQRRNVIRALRIANAKISVPTPPDEIGPQYFTAQEAYATIRFLDDGTTEVDQLSGVYCGIRVQVSGLIRPRSAVAVVEPPKSASERSPFIFVTKSLRELNLLRVSQAPQLDVDFDLNLAQPLDSHVHARLVALDVGYRNVQLQRATVDISMREGAVDIAECRVELGGGELSVNGRYDIGQGRFDLKLSSTVDPTRVAGALPEQWARGLQELRVEERLKIEARYVLSPETGSLPLLKGTVSTGRLEYRRVPFRAIQLAFENQGVDVRVTDARIVTAEGQLTGHGQIQVESSDFSYEVESTLDPRKLLPLMTPVMRQIVEPSWFVTPPHIVATVAGDFVDPDAFAYDATLKTGRCSYRGVALAGAEAKLHLRQSRLEATDMVLRRDEGQLSGSLLADFHNHQIRFDIETTANPTEMAPLLGLKAGEMMRPYRFGPRTSATARGMVDLDSADRSAWTARVVNDGFSYWKITTDQASAALTQTNNVLTINNFEGDVYGGKLRGWAFFSLTNAPQFQVDLTTDHCDVHRLLGAIGGKETQVSGLLTGHCALQGEGSDMARLSGHGNLVITDGVLWEMPLFGIFSRIMDGLSPDLGKTKATDARATFLIGEQCAKTEDLRVSAGAFTLTGHGKVCFDGKLDFRVQAQFMRAVPLINIPGWFLGKILEYKIGGTIGDYTYRPVNVPKELLPHSPDAPKTDHAN